MTIEAAEEKDLDSIFRMEQSRIQNCPSKYEDLCSYLKNPNMELLELLSEQNVIGYIILRYELDEAEIDEIAICKDSEGKGIGTFLLQKSLQHLKEKAIKKVYLEVRKKNSKAIKLYERNGFVSYRIRKNYYGDDDAICYLKEL